MSYGVDWGSWRVSICVTVSGAAVSSRLQLAPVVRESSRQRPQDILTTGLPTSPPSAASAAAAAEWPTSSAIRVNDFVLRRKLRRRRTKLSVITRRWRAAASTRSASIRQPWRWRPGESNSPALRRRHWRQPVTAADVVTVCRCYAVSRHRATSQSFVVTARGHATSCRLRLLGINTNPCINYPRYHCQYLQFIARVRMQVEMKKMTL